MLMYLLLLYDLHLEKGSATLDDIDLDNIESSCNLLK